MVLAVDARNKWVTVYLFATQQMDKVGYDQIIEFGDFVYPPVMSAV
jgi:hypothetical protein